jgi:hypothetical protein
MAGGLVFIAAVKDQPVLLPRSSQVIRVHRRDTQRTIHGLASGGF